MTNLRQEVINLIEKVPEENLMLLMNILQSVRNDQLKATSNSKKIDLSKYMNHGEKLFQSTEEIDEYVKESRNERF